MPLTLQSYRSRQDLYERYSSPAREIEFEGHIYQLIGSKREKDRSLHLYNCEKEQHYIEIYLQFNLPFLVKAFYSIEEVKI